MHDDGVYSQRVLRMIGNGFGVFSIGYLVYAVSVALSALLHLSGGRGGSYLVPVPSSLRYRARSPLLRRQSQTVPQCGKPCLSVVHVCWTSGEVSSKLSDSPHPPFNALVYS